jgi:hypothetical protein
MKGIGGLSHNFYNVLSSNLATACRDDFSLEDSPELNATPALAERSLS